MIRYFACEKLRFNIYKALKKALFLSRKFTLIIYCLQFSTKFYHVNLQMSMNKNRIKNGAKKLHFIIYKPPDNLSKI